jgi:hypothetical protein
MEAEGFTLVTLDDANPNRSKARDAGTTVHGITLEKAQEIFEQQQSKKKVAGPGYISGKEHKEIIKRDFYMFQKKFAQKESLDTLKKSFEEDKKRL